MEKNNALTAMHALAKSLDHIAVPHCPSHVFGPTTIRHNLAIEIEARGRPSTDCIVDAFQGEGIDIDMQFELIAKHRMRMLEVFEHNIPGPDGNIHIVAIHVQVIMPNQEMDWSRVERAVRRMFGPTTPFNVRCRIIVDTLLEIRDFNAKRRT